MCTYVLEIMAGVVWLVGWFFVSCNKIFIYLLLNRCDYVDNSSAEPLTGYHSLLPSSVISLCPS